MTPFPPLRAKVAIFAAANPRWPHQSWWVELGEAEGIPLASPSWIMLSRVQGQQQRLNPRSFRLRVWPLDVFGFLGLVLITVLRAARAPLLGASMLVAGAVSVGADPRAVSRVGVAPNGFCPF